MRVMPSLMLLFGMMLVVQAQQPSPHTPVAVQVPTDLLVLRCSWERERTPGWDKATNGPEPYDIMLARLANERALQAARNANQKGLENRAEDAKKVLERAGSITEKNGKEVERPRHGYRYKVVMKNAGEKTIASVDWDYLITDPNESNEVSRHQFTSDEKIRPGKEKELSVFIFSAPTKVVSSHAQDKERQPLIEEVVLMRIAYSDGTVWQRP